MKYIGVTTPHHCLWLGPRIVFFLVQYLIYCEHSIEVFKVGFEKDVGEIVYKSE